MQVERIGDAILYLGDCIEFMAELPECFCVSATITDPPFGIGNFVQTSGNVRGHSVDWNDAPPPQWVFDKIRAISKHRIIWGANYFNCFEANGSALIWLKDQPMPNFSKAEIASCSHNKKTEIISIPWTNFRNTKVTSHPCERPVQLYEWCIDYLPDCSVVFDPFMGSGSCCVASINMGAKFFGVEINPDYFDMACQRAEAAYRQQRLFA